jgi:5S rRNA maturation endonuclease (ribonuclease M5)
MLTLHDLAGKLENATVRNDQLTARCPAHPDKSPSLSASIGDDGRILIHCFAGCELENILAAVSVDMADLFPDTDRKQDNAKPTIVASYPYTDADGTLLFEVVRLSPKSFRQRQPDGRGGWQWNLKGIESRPLYQLPEVIAAVAAGKFVWLCEGEKDVHRLQRALPEGQVATTIPGGAGKWRDEHTRTLAGAEVMVVADKDGPGRQHATQVRAALEPTGAHVVVVEGLAGKDATDHLNAGYSIHDFQNREQATEWNPDEPAPHHTDADAPEWLYDYELPPIPITPTDPTNTANEDDETDGRTSWWPVDLATLFDGSADLILPTMFKREDGQAIIYPNKAHAFNGEPESGKSWAALIACVQSVNAGLPTLYIDFEDTAQTVVRRLLALGADPETILANFTYISPVEALEWKDKITAGGLELLGVIESTQYALAIIDGVTEAMVLHGLDINSNNDVATFYRILPRRLKTAGSATIQIDHVPKSKDNRGRGGIGGQHKLAGIDVSFLFEATSPFGVGKHGISRISIEKDRPGQLRQHASGKRIAELHLESDADSSTLTAAIKVPPGSTQATSDEWEPTHLMAKVASFIGECNDNDDYPSQNMIEAGVGGKAEYIRTAIANLVKHGYVKRGHSGRKATQHTLVTPYHEPENE